MKSLVIKLIIIVGLCIPSLGDAQSQSLTSLKIGEVFPEFVLQDMHHYSKSEQRISDLKGRYVILDFFNKGCVSCFEAMPHLKEMQEKYKGKLDIILVGVAKKPGLLEGTKKQYEAFRKIHKLNFPVAYDSTVTRKFGISSGPLSVWINRDGIIKAITGGEVVPDNIDLFLANKEFVFEDASIELGSNYTANSMFYDQSKPLLINGNGGSDEAFLSRSVLYETDRNKLFLTNPAIEYQFEYHKGLYQFIGNWLKRIYKVAYFGAEDMVYDLFKGNEQLYGNYFDSPQLNIKDSTKFFFNPATKVERRYNYSLSYPLQFANKTYIQTCLQNDLKRTFGYDAALVEQLRPIYRLVATASAKKNLLAKRQQPDTVSLNKFFGILLRNQPISNLIYCFVNNGTVPPLGDKQIPIIDDTGITSNIDLELDCPWNDFMSVKKALNKVGLDLVEDKKMMKVLVISDPVSTASAQN